ncbi:hypothetical protein NBRC116594_38530 [Shimia sp. NS0008-38b]|uniref:DUF5946 family protein n=1 Tax=Shimia sp. NS0008-38b TaxID=3127653 RepID=UPI00310B1A8C
MASNRQTTCPGCGGRFDNITGPTHAYMISSSGCYAAFNRLLAAEYSDPALRTTHRLTVDTYAVQHAGDPNSRRAVQSVGLHLARLKLQLTHDLPPKETNDVMLGMSEHKATLIPLAPPTRFTLTVADVAPRAGTKQHSAKVRDWAQATWDDYAAHHDYISDWIAKTIG